MQQTADQQIDELIQRHEGSWQLGYHVFPAVIKKMGLLRGAEIGVAFGGHAQAILDNTDVCTLYAIDSYRHRPEYDDPMNLPQPVFDRLFERTGQRLSRFGSRAIQIRQDSVDAANQINEPLDFVYIDGDHSYEGIRADLEAWFAKVRPGGIIAGHDYGQPAFPGVKAATDRFFSRFGLTVQHEGRGVWWAHRPKTPVSVVIAAQDAPFCDASIDSQLINAGLEPEDTIYLVHDNAHSCDALGRVLSKHPNVTTQSVSNLRGPWHAAQSVIDLIKTPMVFPIDLQQPLSPGIIHTLRQRLSHSGAQAAAITTGNRTNDFGLADLLATTAPPIAAGQIMIITQAIKQARHTASSHLETTSERLFPWLILANALATGGRMALEPGVVIAQDDAWTAADCREAAAAIAHHAALIDGTDLLRLKWQTLTSNWLNTLDRKPVRTRVNVRPADTPPIYVTPGLIDRVVHQFRRTIKGAA